MKIPERPGRHRVFATPLEAVRLNDLPRAGGKAAHLGEMFAAGLPVPPAFVVTTDAWKCFMRSNPQIEDGLKQLENCHVRGPAALGAVVKELRQKLAAIPVPDEVTQAIATALAEVSATAWAVRSSATGEDLLGASFAGQYDSFLNVRGDDAVITAVKHCWLSLFSERAISYRAQKGIAPGSVQMAVIVQQFVPANAAGVMFTANSAGDNSGVIFIEAAFGLGEAVVQGKVAPDRIEVSRPELRVVRREIGFKKTQAIANGNGIREELLTPARMGAAVLDDETASRLAELGLKVERFFGAPQDIEWAQRDGKFFLLQSRPITAKAPLKTRADRQVWSNFNSGEVVPDVTTPITWSWWRSLFEGAALRSTFRLLGAQAGRAPLIGLVAGRIYFNVNTAVALYRPFPFLAKDAIVLLQALGGGKAETYRQILAIPPEDLPDLGFQWLKYILGWPRILLDLITHSPRQGERWLARFKTQIDDLVPMDVEAMPTPELIRFCVELIREPLKGWDFLYLTTLGVSLPLLYKALRDWLGETQPALANRLFSALGGMPTAEAGLALWRLALLAHADPDTQAVVDSSDEWLQIRAKLQLAENGRTFLAAWDAFMNEHGHHCRGELELFNARWSETPSYVLGLVRGYLGSIGRCNPLENRQQLAGERERLTGECRKRLENPVKRWIFSRSLRGVQKLAVFRERVKSQAVRRLALIRRALLALGQRLQKQAILSRSDDIFFLEVSEIEAVAMSAACFNWRERIETRRHQYEQNQKLSPPSVIVGEFNPNTAAAPTRAVDGKFLEGIAVSPGVVTGLARVILRADNREQVLSGEILVAPFTDPAWSPYFISAAGLIVEQGGILSHGSIIAREYGLPAITNVDSATRLIHTGDLVEVDGTRGRATILARGTVPSQWVNC